MILLPRQQSKEQINNLTAATPVTGYLYHFIRKHLRPDDDTSGDLGISSFLREPVWERNILAPEIVPRTSLATE